MKTKVIVGIVAVAVLLIGLGRWLQMPEKTVSGDDASVRVTNETKEPFTIPKPETITLTGTYTCLPLADGSTAATDCAFGIKTDDGKYYAVNFGAGAGSMADFTAGARITAKGTIILAADLNPNSWTKFQSEGLFTVLEKFPE